MCLRRKIWKRKICSVDIRCWIHHHQVLRCLLHPIGLDVVINLLRMKSHHLHQFYQNLHRQRILSNQQIRWYCSQARHLPHHPGTLDGVHRYEKICYEEVYLLVYKRFWIINPEVKLNSKLREHNIWSEHFCVVLYIFSLDVISGNVPKNIICFHPFAIGILLFDFNMKCFLLHFFFGFFCFSRLISRTFSY